MANKNVYMYKVLISSTKNGKELPIQNCKRMFMDIFGKHSKNGALDLTLHEYEPVVMDIIENTEEYLFAKLSRKRPNNSIQKRDYKTLKTTEVLAPDEIANSGIEVFTYCMFGYSHGILSIINAKGAPHTEAFSQMFAMYNPEYTLDAQGIPNSDIVRELLVGRAPEINKIHIDIAQPHPQILEELLGLNDQELCDEVGRKTSSLVIDVKPSFGGKLVDDPGLITRLINTLQKNRARFNNIKLVGKKDGTGAQKEYDLYEEYFKYQISVKEIKRENGHQVEVNKETLRQEYRLKMMNVYDANKKTLLVLANR